MKTDNNDSQCYFVQLQFDSYIDGELGESQQASFLQHVNSCAECAAEFRYAQSIQDQLVDLPLLDCSEQSLLPARKLASQDSASSSEKTNVLAQLFAESKQWLSAAPIFLRYAVPVLLLATVGLISLPLLISEPQTSEDSIPIAAVQLIDPTNTQLEYSPEDVAQALRDLTVAIEYLNQVSERTESMVGGRFLMRPLQDRLNASFERVRNNVESEIAGEDI